MLYYQVVKLIIINLTCLDTESCDWYNLMHDVHYHIVYKNGESNKQINEWHHKNNF